MMDPLISVVMPCFNVRPYVGAALASLLRQTHARWEAIVVDDGSTDGTAEQISAVPDSRVRLIRQPNQGVSAARNRGLDEAAGALILFLDADDWLAPDAMARMAASLAEKSSSVAAYGAFCFVNEAGDRVVRCKRGPFPEGDIVERLLVENLFANGGHLLIRARTIRSIGRFRDDLRFGEDWEYWCRLALAGPIATVPGEGPLLFVRQRSTGAYLRMATDTEAFTPCTDAIFGNPELAGRLRPARLARLRRRTVAENGWIVGREQIRHGHRGQGLRRLGQSWRRKPSLKRTLLLGVAAFAPMLPKRFLGPFRPYAAP